MRYEKPVLTLVGSAASIVLGACQQGNSDSFPESNFRKCPKVPTDEVLDD
jgi:hypothetical protein